MRDEYNETNNRPEHISKLENKTAMLQDANSKLHEQVSSLQKQIKQITVELKIKEEKYESLGYKESLKQTQREYEKCLNQIADLQIQKDRIAQDYKRLFNEHSESRSDNVKMGQLIREYEEKVSALELNSKESIFGLESNIKILKSDNKILQNENKKLINQYVEASND